MVSNENFHNAIQLYTSMHKAGFLPDNFTFPFVLKACARFSLFQLGVTIHCLVFKTGFDSHVFVKTNLVCLYSKARKVFDDIVDKNVVSWTAIICGEAIDLFRGLLEMGLKPDGFLIVRVLRACGKLGDLESGRWIRRYMGGCGLSRNVFVMTSLVDMYAKCGSMEEARCVFGRMVEKDVVCWSAMIQGYASNGLPRETLDLFFEMRKENLKPDCYSMVGVLSACARLGALELGNWAKGLMDDEEFCCILLNVFHNA